MMLYAILDDVLKIVFVVALKNNNTIFPQEQFKKRTFGLDFFFFEESSRDRFIKIDLYQHSKMPE